MARTASPRSRELAVCLVSGGMDSCVAAAMAARRYDLAILHVNYGQRTERRELRAFTEIADFFGVPRARRLVIDMAYLGCMGGSSLTDRRLVIPAPALRRTSVPSTYVPFRNANLLAAAGSWAEAIGAKRVFIGAMGEDSSGYPDCRGIFYDAFNASVRFGTKARSGIRVDTPLMRMGKAEAIRWGMRHGAPLHLTWSCYRSNGPEACGRCDSCALRLRGFLRAGYEDPIPYAKRPPR